MSDETARQALLEAAQEIDRLRGLVESLADRVRELETRYQDDGK